MITMKIRHYELKYTPLLDSLGGRDRQTQEFSRHIIESVEYLDSFVNSGSKRTDEYDNAVDTFDDAIKYYAGFSTDGLRGKINSKLPKFTLVQKMNRVVLSLYGDLLDECPESRINASTKSQERLA